MQSTDFHIFIQSECKIWTWCNSYGIWCSSCWGL